MSGDACHTMNELYLHRNLLFLRLMQENSCDAWISETHNDGSCEEGWFIAGLDLLDEPITYHMSMELWDLAVLTGADVLECAPPWDGHTPDDVCERLEDQIKYYG